MKINPKEEYIASNSWLLLTLITIIMVFTYSIFYPALNWPDEIYKISTLHFSENLYLNVLDWLQGSGCGFQYSSLIDGGYGSNRFEFQILSGSGCYRELKIYNAILIIAIILSCLVLIRRDKKHIFLMALIWPSSLFFLTSINNQVVFHVISIALGVYSIYSRHLFIAIIISLLLISVDRSFITTLIFLSLLQSLRINFKFTIIGVLLLLVFNQFSGNLLENIYGSILGPDARSLSDTRLSNEIYRDSIFFSIALLAASFVYLGGTAAVFGIGLDYLFVYFYLGKNLLDLKNKTPLYNILLSLISTFFIVIQFVPSIQSFRYYVFILPFIIDILLKNRHKKYYIIYCITFSLIYLLLAYFVQGGKIWFS